MKKEQQELRERLTPNSNSFGEQLNLAKQVSLTFEQCEYLLSLIEASGQGWEKPDRRPWYEKHIEQNQATINDLKNRIKDNEHQSPELDAGGLFKDYWEGEIPWDEKILVEYPAIINAMEDFAEQTLSHHQKQWDAEKAELVECVDMLYNNKYGGQDKAKKLLSKHQ